MLHSSVVARQGLHSRMRSPRHRLHRKLMRKIPCANTVSRIAKVMNARTGPTIAAMAAMRLPELEVRVRDQAEPVHGREDAVDAGERQPEMNFAERFVQAASENLGEPEKKARQESRTWLRRP